MVQSSGAVLGRCAGRIEGRLSRTTERDEFGSGREVAEKKKSNT